MLLLVRRAMNQKTLVTHAWTQFLARQLSDLKAEPHKATCLENNPHYSKYADKLKKAASNSTKSVQPNLEHEEMRVKGELEELNSQLKRTQCKDLKQNSNGEKPRPKCYKTASYVKRRKLDDIVKLELLAKHTADEIRDIWCQYFRGKKDCIFACIKNSTYDLLRRNAEKYPLFVFPLPVLNHDAKAEETKKCSYQFVLAQFHNDQIYFTPLIMYQSHGDHAPPCLTINHFTEMKQSKGVVLMEGEYDKHVFKSFEAQCLANQVQLFYATQDSKRNELLHRFNQNPTEFNHMDIINLFESL